MNIRKLSRVTSLVLLVCMTFTDVFLTPEAIYSSDAGNIIADEIVTEDTYEVVTENTVIDNLNIISNNESTVSQEVYLENENKVQFSLIFEILDKKERYSELTEEEKELVQSIYNIDEGIIKECELKGYSLIDAINIAFRVKEYSLSIDEVESLLLAKKDIVLVDKELIRLKYFNERINLTSDEIDTILGLLLEGYSIESIKPAFIVSSAFGLQITQLLIKSEDFNKQEVIKSIGSTYTEDEIMCINDILDRYTIDIIDLLSYAKQNDLQVKDIMKKIINYEANRSADSSNKDAEMTGESPVNYEKYFSVPYSIKDDNNENILLNTGALEYNISLLSLSGRNGLDIDITLRYNSQQAAFYEPDYYIEEDYDYKVKKYETQYWSNWIGIGEYKPTRLVSTHTHDTYSRARNDAIDWENSSYIIPGYWADGTDLIVVRNADIYEFLCGEYYINTTNPNTYTELNNNLGSGWSLGFPSIESDGGSKYLHLGDGSVYRINITSIVGDSNLEKYTLKDMRLETDNGSYSNGERPSAYVLIYSNGTKNYFANDGSLLAIQDRYQNTIKFQHIVINGHPVINKITDTLGRVINISYQNTSTGKKVIITAPDNTSVQCILEPIQGYSSDYALKKIIDQEGRETTFDYSIETGKFSFFSKSSRNTNNVYANLTKIAYPTGANTKYTYEKSVRNLSSSGSEEYFRILTREDVENAISYNKLSYSYSADNYTGYPTNKNPSSLPTTFTYNTTITDSKNTKGIYTFNYMHLKTSDQIKENGAIQLKENAYNYDTNKLPAIVTLKSYTPSTGTSLAKEIRYNYNDYGDLLEYIDELGYKTTYTYENNYHQLTSEARNIDSTTIQKTEYGVNQFNGNIDWKKQKHIVNGVDKPIMTYYTYDSYGNMKTKKVIKEDGKYSLQGTTQGNGLTGGLPPVRFSM